MLPLQTDRLPLRPSLVLCAVHAAEPGPACPISVDHCALPSDWAHIVVRADPFLARSVHLPSRRPRVSRAPASLHRACRCSLLVVVSTYKTEGTDLRRKSGRSLSDEENGGQRLLGRSPSISETGRTPTSPPVARR